MLVKLYGNAQDEHHYSPGVCIGFRPQYVSGYSDPKHVPTSYVERQNQRSGPTLRNFFRRVHALSQQSARLGVMVRLPG
ncbi:MAG TPA: hypothetical protein VEB22_09970 [Phycisphaerales bacterium]|nr:hypothetical protein [Phycisphaerales bacterium]